MGVKKFTIAHDRANCIGCGSCALIAPQQRSMNNEDGLSCLTGAVCKGRYMVAPVDMDELEVNREAAAACPVNVIQISPN